MLLLVASVAMSLPVLLLFLQGFAAQDACVRILLGRDAPPPASTAEADTAFVARLASFKQWASDSRVGSVHASLLLMHRALNSFVCFQLSLQQWLPVLTEVHSVLLRTLDACPFVTILPNAAPMPQSSIPDFIIANSRIAILLRFLFIVLEQQCHSSHLPVTLSAVRARGFAVLYFVCDLFALSGDCPITQRA
jgi:hypothetical protein